MKFRFNILPPKRFRKPWCLSILASSLAICFAIGPNFNGAYNPSLAVLTLTLIAVIWYTYFTYQAVHREQPTIIQIKLDAEIHYNHIGLQLTISNPTQRRVSVSPILELWLDSDPVDQSSFYSGSEETLIQPYDNFYDHITIEDDIMQSKQEPRYGEIVPTKEALLVKFSLSWRDDLGEEGNIEPRYWEADISNTRWIAHVEHKKIKALFSGLKKP